MGVWGALSGDLQRCLIGNDKEACERVYIGYYLLPIFQKIMEREGLHLIDDKFNNTSDLVQDILTVLILKEINPKDTFFPAEVKLKAIEKVSAAIKEFQQILDLEASQLKTAV